MLMIRESSRREDVAALPRLSDAVARFKRRGVGRGLLHAVETAALRKQINRVMMEVGIRNTDGQALYRGAGFRERGQARLPSIVPRASRDR